MNIKVQQILKTIFLLLILATTSSSGWSQVGLKQNEVGFINTPLLIKLTSVNVDPFIVVDPAKGEVISIKKITPITWQIEYQPNKDYIGFDQITVKHFADYPPNIAVGLVQTDISITIVPSLVEAHHDYGITEEGQTLSIKVIDNDSVSKGELGIRPIFPVVNHGKASLSGKKGFVDFKPEAGFTGLADFNYIACDSIGTCATGAASIYVNPKGKIFNDEIRLGTGQNTTKAIPMPFKVTGTDLPSNVQIELSQYAVVYKPDFDFAGQQVFTVFGENGNQRIITMDVISRGVNILSLAANDITYGLLDEKVRINVIANDNIERVSRVEYFVLNGGTYKEISNGLIEFTPKKGFNGVARIAYKAYDPNFNEHWAYAYIIYDRHNFGPNDQDYAYDFYVNPGQTKTIDYNVPITNYQLLPDENAEIYGELEAMSKGSLVYYAPEEGGFDDEFEVLYCAPANAHPDDCQKVKVTMHIVEENVVNGCSNDCVLPGDLNADGIVNSIDLLSLGLHIGAEGPARSDKSTQFTPHVAANWEMALVEGVNANLKHQDANGDGVLTEKDVQAIIDNYGQLSQLIPYSPPALAKGISIKPRRVKPSLEEVPLGEPIPAGTLIEIEIALGEENAQELDLYGFTFPFKLGGKSFIDPASFKITFHDDSWAALNSPTLSLQKEVESNNADQISLDFGFTRTSRTSVSGTGKLATVGFIVVEDNIDGFKRPDDIFNLDMEIGQSYSIDGKGQYYQYEGVSMSVPVSFENTKAAEGLTPAQLNVYPNPTSSELTLQLDNTSRSIQEVAIFNIAGQQMYHAVNLATSNLPVPVGQLAEGLYSAQVRTEEGVVTRKFEILRK